MSLQLVRGRVRVRVRVRAADVVLAPATRGCRLVQAGAGWCWLVLAGAGWLLQAGGAGLQAGVHGVVATHLMPVTVCPT